MHPHRGGENCVHQPFLLRMFINFNLQQIHILSKVCQIGASGGGVALLAPVDTDSQDFHPAIKLSMFL